MGNMTHESKQQPDFQKLAELIKDIRVAMLTTFPGGDARLGEPGGPRSRPMYTQKLETADFDGTLWFMTDAESAKVDELEQNPAVLLTYAAPDKNRFVSVNGQAHAERNPAKARELWNIHAKGWWPNGPTDAALLLIEVHVESAEYWDGPSNTSYMLSLLKAVATGDRIKANAEHGEI